MIANRFLAVLLAAALFAGAAHAQTGLRLPNDAKPRPGLLPGDKPAAQKPVTAPTPQPEGKVLQEIFACLAAGLPRDWRTVTVEVNEVSRAGAEREFDVRYSYTDTASPKTEQPLVPCHPQEPALGVLSFNQLLAPEQRGWKQVKFVVYSDGKYDIRYEY